MRKIFDFGKFKYQFKYKISNINFNSKYEISISVLNFSAESAVWDFFSTVVIIAQNDTKNIAYVTGKLKKISLEQHLFE